MNTPLNLDGLFSAVVADVLDSLGYRHQCPGPQIRALTPADRIEGRVFTMRAEAVSEAPAEPYKLEMLAIDQAMAGDVFVIDAGFDTSCGFWGELLTTACIAKGIRGIVMNACTRDRWALNSLPFPVFGIGTNPADSLGRTDVVALGEPVKLGGVTVKNGDIVLGDTDGIVFIPSEVAEEAVRLAHEKVSGENTVRDELAAGFPVSEVFRRHGIL